MGRKGKRKGKTGAAVTTPTSSPSFQLRRKNHAEVSVGKVKRKEDTVVVVDEAGGAADVLEQLERRCLSESDADLDNGRHLSDANNSGSSSTSSISRSLESPQSTSLELVNQSSTSLPGQRGSETPETTLVHHQQYHHHHHHSSAEGKHHHAHAWPHHYTYFAEGDSDIEVEQDPPDLAKIVPEEELSRMDRKEKKRQEVLNELCHTERSHVRNLKVLDRLFHRPIRQKEMIPAELVGVVFSNLENMLELHEKFNNALKRKRKENPVIDEIGSLLLETFDGENGTYFKSNAAFFCSKQQIGLEQLKERRRQDPKFHTFLADQEANPLCRRLQVSDMIPMAMQRLTKYPLLFESLCNCTPPDSEEYKKIQRAVELSREILSSVNRKKKEAENHQRLVDIQKSLDKSYLDKNNDKADSSVIGELKNLDFTNHRLLLEGSLRWRMLPSKGSKQKSDFLDVQAVLLDDMIVLLLKENDRLVLKMHHWSMKSPTVHVRPIIRFQNLRLSENAAENRAFFIINTASTNMNMYELWCSSKDERTKWLQHIKEAVDDYKTRQEESKRGDVHPTSNNIPAVAPGADDKFKDVNDAGEAHPTPGGDSSAPATQNGDDQQQTQGHEGFSKDASPAPDSLIASAAAGNLNPSAESPKSSTVSPNPNRRKGEFLRITESAPLIQPCEVVVATRDVQFATPVVSQYEELKRIDAEIGKLMDTKNKLLTKLSPQPANVNGDGSTTIGSEAVVARLESPGSSSSHAKQLVTACMLQVDQLGRLLATQKLTADSLTGMRDPAAIHYNLNGLLTQLLLEIQRRDDDSEMRRQELSRLREQNHGYQERLQVRNGSEKHVSPVRQSTPNASPAHSRPNSFLSLSSSSDPHEEDRGDGKDSISKTTITAASVPEATVGNTEEETSRSNGHSELSAPAPPVDMTAIISAVLDEQKPMKGNMTVGDGENESGKALHSLIEETIEPQRKLS